MMKPEQMFDLSGKNALVTGSSQGIGRAMATSLALAGAKVFIHGRSDSDNLRGAVSEITSLGGQVESVVADLSDMEAIAAMIEKIVPLDILILNASAQSYQTIEDFSPEEFEFQYNVNVRSSFQLIQGFVAGMQEKGWGRIITVGSVNQFKPSPRLPIYASTKSALVNLMSGCAKQYAPYGITVNNIAPGVITTERNREALAGKDDRERVLSMIPAAKFGAPGDCSGLALLLSSDAGSYITGADIPVTGGMHL